MGFFKPPLSAKVLVEMGVRVGYILAMVQVSKYALPPDVVIYLAVGSIVEHVAELNKLYEKWPELRALQPDEATAYGLQDASPELLKAIARQGFANQFKPEKK